MVMLRTWLIAAALGALDLSGVGIKVGVGVVRAQFPPTPKGVTVLDSHVEDGVRISYKEVS